MGDRESCNSTAYFWFGDDERIVEGYGVEAAEDAVGEILTAFAVAGEGVT